MSAPEPVDISAATAKGSSELLSLPTDHLVIGILGGIGLRKNPSVLIEAATALPEVVAVVAGRFSQEVKALATGNRSWLELRKARRLVELDDRLLTSEEFDGLLRQLTAVAILHDNDAPSGILCEAAARGKPAIVASGGWLEQIVTALGFGIATDVTTEGVSATLKSFASYRTDLESNAARASGRLGTDAFVNALLHQVYRTGMLGPSCNFTAVVGQAMLDPLRGYAIRDELPDAVASCFTQTCEPVISVVAYSNGPQVNILHFCRFAAKCAELGLGGLDAPHLLRLATAHLLRRWQLPVPAQLGVELRRQVADYRLFGVLGV